jgi:hypothetical protein
MFDCFCHFLTVSDKTWDRLRRSHNVKFLPEGFIDGIVFIHDMFLLSRNCFLFFFLFVHKIEQHK